ncbi:MAG: N-acetylmuramic acid 6-phosphate etherase [Vulcanimicrobiaceae bacterium]
MTEELLPPTEAVDDATHELDRLSTSDLVELLVSQQRRAVDAVRSAVPQIAQAVEAIASRLAGGGTLHYVGAGTSGRLGILDAAEAPPTFGTPPSLVRAHIAGGLAAVVAAVEGAEDDAGAAERMQAEWRRDDALIGISASGGAKFVIAAVERARSAGAYTVALTSAARSQLATVADLAIVLETGAEPLAGSTRMLAGTAQKIALNAISTATMVRLGKTYGNLMVDLVATNDKLRRRAMRLVSEVGMVDPARAGELLSAAGGSVKVAIVMARRNLDAAGARDALSASGGRLRAVLED